MEPGMRLLVEMPGPNCKATDGYLHVPQGSAALRCSDGTVVVLKAGPPVAGRLPDVYTAESWRGILHLTSSGYSHCAEIKGTISIGAFEGSFYLHDSGTPKVEYVLRGLAACAHFLESHSHEDLPLQLVDDGHLVDGLVSMPVRWMAQVTCAFDEFSAMPQAFWRDCMAHAGVQLDAVQCTSGVPHPAGDRLFL
uniref:Uncharacterized protein n=1 Tax=Alexandrium andersonii TaxID=327968 RepID=A0A7S2MUH0_9DINO|mmetsp:Transcript_76297/g.170697  ORF Transcript_76297/g.170697 Transcript_76297/m.170697 type:complete len:194 (+) Transcript_76297:161-742(+)